MTIDTDPTPPHGIPRPTLVLEPSGTIHGKKNCNMHKNTAIAKPIEDEAPPAPLSVRNEIRALVIEYQPVELGFAVDYSPTHATVYGKLASGHTVVSNTVLLDQHEQVEAQAHIEFKNNKSTSNNGKAAA